MHRSSILPILLSLALIGCGSDGGGEGVASSESASVDAGAAAPGVRYEQPDIATGAATESSAAPALPSAQVQVNASDTSATAPEGPVPAQPAASLNTMLIRTGTATLEVDSLEQGMAQVRAVAQRLGGIVGNTTINSGAEEVRQATMELRIPSAAFDRAVAGLSPLGRVESVNVTAEDVGEEYTDVLARVANARRLEGRLLDLLENRTGRLEEVLNLERELARVREEIERYDGRLRYLRTRASVSVLTVTLHEPMSGLGAPGERPILNAFREAWRNFVRMIAGLIAASGVLIPLGLVLYGVWRGVRWLRRRERDRDAAYREMLRRERERTGAPEEPAARP